MDTTLWLWGVSFHCLLNLNVFTVCERRNKIHTYYCEFHENAEFKMRRMVLHEHTGDFMLHSVHFPARVAAIITKLKEGRKCTFVHVVLLVLFATVYC